MEQRAFISKIKDKAIELQSTYKILASITIAQAILESGWGTSPLFINANNCFGIKWDAYCGYDKYLITTKEIVDGKEVSVKAYFRKYNTLEDSIKDHAIFLQKVRYQNIIGDSNYISVANNLYIDGYSTSSLYPSKLIDLIRLYDLNSYDNIAIKNEKEGNKMKIGLRAGHSDNCTGAVGIVDEHNQMKLYYSAIKSVLEKYGHTVIDCNSNASSEGAELSEGATIANNNGVDLFVSLHMNCFNGSAHGVEALVSSESSGSYAYAQRLVDNFVAIGLTNRGVKCESLYEMNHVSAPNIIFELLFCDSETDIAIYNQYSFEQLAYRFCNAIDSNIPVSGGSNSSVSTTKLGWNQNSTGWWYCTDVANGYYYKDVWKLIDGEWYSFDGRGYARQKTWYKDKLWYYLKDSCKMAKSEWLWIEGECYCFNKDGALYVSCTTPDGYKVDENGAWIQ